VAGPVPVSGNTGPGKAGLAGRAVSKWGGATVNDVIEKLPCNGRTELVRTKTRGVSSDVAVLELGSLRQPNISLTQLCSFIDSKSRTLSLTLTLHNTTIYSTNKSKCPARQSPWPTRRRFHPISQTACWSYPSGSSSSPSQMMPDNPCGAFGGRPTTLLLVSKHFAYLCA
jgi:hypothetical protein